MESVKHGRERGQILVQVAIMVGVLFAFVALAVDAGHVYGGRRRMQNAADAGALAGAQAICFDDATDDVAMGIARDYAVLNGAEDPPAVDLVGDYRTVVVTAHQTLDTFFAGVIGINEANVQAEAAATCGPVSSARGAWPLAFDYDTYTDTVDCGDEFVVFDSVEVDCAEEITNTETETEESCASECESVTGDVLDKKHPCYDTCDCGLSGPTIGPGDYGWLDLPSPAEIGENYDVPSDCVETAGGKRWLECWILNDFPALIDEGMCVRGESGVMAATEDDVNARGRDVEESLPGDIVQIILWDRLCDENDPEPLGQEGTAYHVAGFGCIEVIGYRKDYVIVKCGDSSKACAKNIKVVDAKRICPPDEDTGYTGDEGWEDCRASGSTTGTGDPNRPWTVSLIQWPPAEE